MSCGTRYGSARLRVLELALGLRQPYDWMSATGAGAVRASYPTIVQTAQLHVLTGAPGTGKTAVLEVLSVEVECIREPARAVLAEQRLVDGDGTPDRDPSLFVDLLLRLSIGLYEDAQRRRLPTLFDRGIPDCIAYAAVLGVDPSQSVHGAATHRYANAVLMFEPWEEIYTTDDERRMSFDDTVAFHEALVSAYKASGYELLRVPQASIETRAAFVRQFIAGPEA